MDRKDLLQQTVVPQKKKILKAELKEQCIIDINTYKLEFNIDFNTRAIHYAIKITPVASKNIQRQVFEKCRIINFKERHPAFDGKSNAFSANDLPLRCMQTHIEIYNECKRQKFEITFKKIANIDLSWIKNLHPDSDKNDRNQAGIHALNVIMHCGPQSRFLSVGRSLFWKMDNSGSLGDGLSLSRGGFLSVILGWKPYIYVDVVHKAFPTSQNVIDLITELIKARGNLTLAELISNRWNQEKIEKFLKDLKIIYEIPGQSHTKQTYYLHGLGPSAVQHQINYNKSQITIAEYFIQSKNYELCYPDLPCLWANATNREEKRYLPAEL